VCPALCEVKMEERYRRFVDDCTIMKTNHSLAEQFSPKSSQPQSAGVADLPCKREIEFCDCIINFLLLKHTNPRLDGSDFQREHTNSKTETTINFIVSTEWSAFFHDGSIHWLKDLLSQ
jgi:hypothetical protein